MSRAAAELLRRPLREIGRAIRAGETTPRALAEAALAGLDGEGRALNAVAALLPERAVAEAEQAAAELRAGVDRGPLHGIPYGAKDLFAAQGAPTTWGAARGTAMGDTSIQAYTAPGVPSNGRSTGSDM